MWGRHDGDILHFGDTPGRGQGGSDTLGTSWGYPGHGDMEGVPLGTPSVGTGDTMTPWGHGDNPLGTP